MRWNPQLLCLALAATVTALTPTVAAVPPAASWEIGPTIRGRNHSVGLPPSPVPFSRGWYFDFPYPHVGAGHVHYVTFDPGPLAGKSRIVVRYRVEAAGNVRFIPRENPSAPATVSLYLQRQGDSWSGGRHEFFRWYAPTRTVTQISPGEHEMIVSLRDPLWTSVRGRPTWQNPAAFEAALAETDRMGLVFGSTEARGHGVYSTGPARFRLISFQVL